MRGLRLADPTASSVQPAPKGGASSATRAASTAPTSARSRRSRASRSTARSSAPPTRCESTRRRSPTADPTPRCRSRSAWPWPASPPRCRSTHARGAKGQQRGVRRRSRRGGLRHLPRRTRTAPSPPTGRPRSSPTTSSAAWPPSSSHRRRASSRGRRAVLLTERIDAPSRSRPGSRASPGVEAVELGEQDGQARHRRRAEARCRSPAPTRPCSTPIQGRTNPYVTGTYDPAFASAWTQVAAMQREPHRGERLVEARSVPASRLARPARLTVKRDRVSPASRSCGSGAASVAVLGLLQLVAARDCWSGWCSAAAVAYFVYQRMLPAAQRTGFGAGPAHRVVPPVPPRERGQARRVGVVERAAARVLGLGRRAR